MYKRYLIIASKLDPAGINITTQLSQFKQNPMLSSMANKPSFDFYLIDTPIVDDSGIDKGKLARYDFVIFASKHKSEKGGKTLSIHAPGNWHNADYGGFQGKVSKTSALFQKFFFEKLHKNVKEYDLRDYSITLECTHHGPLIDVPCLFVELGATETEWKDHRAGFILAKTISDVIDTYKENPYNEVAIGIGGPHYCPNFNKLQLDSNIALSHVIPEYALPLTDEMIKEAVSKTAEEVDFALIDWKGVGTAEQRDAMLRVLDRNYISWKRTSDIKK
jgi:D-aminoacyl-tRNA deacylase